MGDSLVALLQSICFARPSNDHINSGHVQIAVDAAMTLGRTNAAMRQDPHPVAAAIDAIMAAGQSDPSVDLSAAVGVAERILRQCTDHRGRLPREGCEASLARAITTRLSNWLENLLRDAKDDDITTKTRRQIVRMHERNWLQENCYTRLLDLVDTACRRARSPPLAKRSHQETSERSSSRKRARLDSQRPRLESSQSSFSYDAASKEIASATVTTETLPEASVPVQMLPSRWRVLGDCRCLFRAICRSRDDPKNEIKRSFDGEATSEILRASERERADELRASVCGFMRQNCEVIAALLGADLAAAADYITGMEDWRTWGDAICLHFMATHINRPIQVYALNIERGCIYDSGLYLPDICENLSVPVGLWYNGKSHYDIITPDWMLKRETAGC